MASIFENIRNRTFGRNRNTIDDGLQVRLAAIPGKENEIGVSSRADDVTNQQITADSSLIDATEIDKFVSLSKYRDERYQAFEEMLKDPIVSAALEMYADDATQYNRDGNIIWAEADDPVIAEAANRYIRILELNKNAWRHIYSLCTYGDLYFRLYKEGDTPDKIDYSNEETSEMTVIPEDRTRHLEQRIEYVTNPATVFDLQEKDKTVGFIRTKASINATSNYINHNYLGNGFSSTVSSIQSRNCEMLYNKAFIHIMLSESINRAPEYISVDDDKGNSKIYKIKTGKSALEDAYPATRRLDLLQDSLILNRLSRSAILRILQIEVGDAPKPEVENILRRVKNLVEQKMAVNTETGRARSYNNPGPVENTIYVPVRGERGSISSETLGGDVDIKSIVDVEYFQNLKLAALKIPKQFLNFDSAEGFSNGTSLVKSSSRYAHTIMRIQSAYKNGIANLLNVFFLDAGLDYVNKFTIKMVSPSTVEDTERSEQLTDRIAQARDTLDLLDSVETSKDVKRDILINLLNDFIGFPEVADELNKFIKSNNDKDDESKDNTSDDLDNF